MNKIIPKHNLFDHNYSAFIEGKMTEEQFTTTCVKTVQSFRSFLKLTYNLVYTSNEERDQLVYYDFNKNNYTLIKKAFWSRLRIKITIIFKSIFNSETAVKYSVKKLQEIMVQFLNIDNCNEGLNFDHVYHVPFSCIDRSHVYYRALVGYTKEDKITLSEENKRLLDHLSGDVDDCLYKMSNMKDFLYNHDKESEITQKIFAKIKAYKDLETATRDEFNNSSEKKWMDEQWPALTAMRKEEPKKIVEPVLTGKFTLICGGTTIEITRDPVTGQKIWKQI